MVTHLDEVEARLLGPDGLADELGRCEALRRQLVTELHAVLLPSFPFPSFPSAVGHARLAVWRTERG